MRGWYLVASTLWFARAWGLLLPRLAGQSVVSSVGIFSPVKVGNLKVVFIGNFGHIPYPPTVVAVKESG